jgi:hypothetical protein
MERNMISKPNPNSNPLATRSPGETSNLCSQEELVGQEARRKTPTGRERSIDEEVVNRRYIAGDMGMICGTCKTMPGGASINQLHRRGRLNMTVARIRIIW